MPLPLGQLIFVESRDQPIPGSFQKRPWVQGCTQAELERMKQLDVVDRINEPSDWVSSLVIVEKPNGQIRLCLDPRDLNKAIKRHHHPMPVVDEILA